MDKPTTKEYYTIRSNLFNSIRGSLYRRAPTKLKDWSERSRITYMHVSLLSRLLYVYQIRYFLNVVHNIASCHRKKNHNCAFRMNNFWNNEWMKKMFSFHDENELYLYNSVETLYKLVQGLPRIIIFVKNVKIRYYLVLTDCRTIYTYIFLLRGMDLSSIPVVRKWS